MDRANVHFPPAVWPIPAVHTPQPSLDSSLAVRNESPIVRTLQSRSGFPATSLSRSLRPQHGPLAVLTSALNRAKPVDDARPAIPLQSPSHTIFPHAASPRAGAKIARAQTGRAHRLLLALPRTASNLFFQKAPQVRANPSDCDAPLPRAALP